MYIFKNRCINIFMKFEWTWSYECGDGRSNECIAVDEVGAIEASSKSSSVTLVWYSVGSIEILKSTTYREKEMSSIV